MRAFAPTPEMVQLLTTIPTKEASRIEFADVLTDILKNELKIYNSRGLGYAGYIHTEILCEKLKAKYFKDERFDIVARLHKVTVEKIKLLLDNQFNYCAIEDIKITMYKIEESNIPYILILTEVKLAKEIV